MNATECLVSAGLEHTKCAKMMNVPDGNRILVGCVQKCSTVSMSNADPTCSSSSRISNVPS
eukprot:348190-Hanusia_phi.AAC.2